MAGNVDNRIVQMQFENRQFERNIAKSKKSLNELKAAMDFEETSKGLDKFSRGLNELSFSRLEENIQRLTDKFTGLGTVTELVISQIRRKIEEAARAVSNFVDSMTTQQVHAGMEKFNMLNKSVQTIKAATGRNETDVYEVLDRLNKYTDQTSYNFSDMAQNIGKFTSVGISLENAEKQMEGIANWAARSGAGINEASRAMYNLSQAMGVGKLTLIDWKSIENAGMATKEFKEQLIQAGIEAGTLVEKNGQIMTAASLGKQVEVTYQNVGSTLNKAWATSAVLQKTLEKYYYEDLELSEATAESILKLSETQKKSFDSMIESGKKLDKAEWKQLTEMGVLTDDVKQKILDLAISQNKLTKTTEKDGKVIYKTVNKNGKQIEFTIDKIEDSLSAGWFDKGIAAAITSVEDLARSSYEAAKKCLTFTDVLQAWKDQISTGWMQSFTYVFGELSESMEFFSRVCDRVGDAIGILIDLRNDALEVWKDADGRTNLIRIILGDYGEDVKTGAFGLLDALEGVGKLVFDGFKDFMMLFARPIDEAAVAEKPEYFATYLGYMLSDTTKKIQEFLTKVKTFFNEEVTINGETTSRLAVIKEIVKGVAGAMKIGYDIVTKLIDFLAKVTTDLSPGLDSFLGLLGDLGRAIYDTATETSKGNKIAIFFTQLREKIHPLVESINILMTSISGFFRKILGLDQKNTTYTETIQKIGDTILRVADIVSRVTAPIIKFISKIIDLAGELFTGGFSAENLKNFGKGLGDAFDAMIKEMPEKVQKVFNFVSKLWNKITGFFKGDSEDGETPFEKIADRLASGYAKLKKFFSTLKTNVSNEGLVGGVKKTFQDMDLSKALSPENLKAKGESLLKKIKAFFTGLWTKITALIRGDNVTDDEKQDTLLDRVVGWIQDGYNKFKSAIQRLVGNAEGDSRTFANTLKNLSWSKIMMVLLGGASIAGISVIVAKVIGTVRMVAKAIKMIGQILTGEKAIAPTIFGEKDEESFGDKMLKIAGAIAIVAAALILIGNMKTEDAIKGILGIMAIAGLMVGAAFLMKKAFKEMNPKQGAALFLGMYGMATAVARIANALIPIASIDDKGMMNIISTLIVIFGGLIILSKVVSTDENSSFMKFGVLLFGLSFLIISLKRIADMKPEQLLTMLGTLAAILIELGVFVWAIGRMKGNGLSGKDLTQLAAVAAAVAILVLSLKAVANMKPEQLLKMVGVLAVILGEFIGFIWAINKASMDGKKLSQLTILAAAVAILVATMIPLALLPFKRVMWALLAVSVIIGELLAVAWILDKKDTTMAGLGLTQLLAVAGAVVLVALALIPLSLVPWDKLKYGLIAVTVIMVLLAGMVWVAGKAQAKATSMLGLLAVAASIALLVMVLTPLALMEWEGLIKMGAALVVIAVSLMLMLSKVSKVKASAVAATSLLVAVVSLLVLSMGAAMHDLKDMDWKIIASFAVGLGLVVWAVGSALSKLQNVDLVKGLKAILLLAAAVAAIGAVIALIGPMIITSFGHALGEVGGYLELFASCIGTFTDRMEGADEGSIQKAGNVIDQLIGIMKKLGEVTAYTGNIGAFQTAMFELGTAVEIFHNHTDGAGSIKGNAAFELIQGLASCAGDLDIIARMNLDNLTAKIAGLGGAMSLYAMGVKETAESTALTGLEPGELPDVTGAMTLLKAITKAFADEEEGFEIPKNMPSTDEIGTFGAQLAALAMSLVKFEEAGKGLGSGTQEAIKTIDYFKNLKDELISHKAMLQDMGIIGEFNASMGTLETEGSGTADHVLTEFGAHIEALGSALSKFANSTSRYNEDTKQMEPIDFTQATSALQSFADIQSQLPNVGSAVTWLVGRKTTFVDLGAQIEAAATALSDLSMTICGGTDSKGNTHQAFNPASVGIARTALQSMADFMKVIGDQFPNIGGASNIAQSVVHGRAVQIQDVKKEWDGIGQALNDLSVAICGGRSSEGKTYDKFNPGSISIASQALTEMKTFLRTIHSQMPSVGGLINGLGTLVFGRPETFSEMVKEWSGVGPALNELSACISGGTFTGEDGEPRTYTAFNPSSIGTVNTALDKMADFLKEIRGKLQNVGGLLNIGSTMISGRAGNLQDIISEWTGIGPALNDLSVAICGGTITDKDGKPTTFKAFNQAAPDIAEKALTSMMRFIKVVRSNMPNVGGLIDIVHTFIHGRAGNMDDLKKEMQDLGEGMNSLSTSIGDSFNIDGVQAALASVESLARIMGVMATVVPEERIFDGYELVTRLNEFIMAFNGLNTIGTGVTDSEGNAVKPIEQIVKAMSDLSMRLSRSQVDPNAIKMFSDFATALYNLTAVTMATEFEQIGQNIAAGIATGIEKGEVLVTDAASKLVIVARDAAKEAGIIKSPSRLFAVVGGYLSEGMAVGMTEQAGVVEQASAALVTDGLQAMEDSMNLKSAGTLMAALSQAMTEGIDPNPTITPVLNMDQAREEWLSFQRGFGGSYLDLGMSSNIAGRIGSDDKSTQDTTAKVDFNGIYDRMNDMNERIALLGDSIKQMRLVLDTGVIAGGVTDRVDELIGQKIWLLNRGNTV